MIEVTNIKKSGELKLGMKDKNGNSINFVYGMVLTEKEVDKEVLEASLKDGLLKNYLYKGWIATKRINVQGAIIGAPMEFKGISANELDGTVKIHSTEAPLAISDAMVEAINNVATVKTEAPKVEEAPIVATEVTPVAVVPEPAKKKTGRPKATTKLNEQEIKDIKEVEEERPATPPTLIDVKAGEIASVVAEVKKEDEFI